MPAKMNQPRNEHGQWVSIATLFQRERVEHQADHDRERVVDKETAQRLALEVEDTAQRLERLVAETAARLEKAVAVALEAVAATAVVHSEAHTREHASHERIHAVEKVQEEKLEKSLEFRLQGMNEFRAALSDQTSKFISRELFDTQAEKINTLETRIAYYAGVSAVAGASVALFLRILGVGGH